MDRDDQGPADRRRARDRRQPGLHGRGQRRLRRLRRDRRARSSWRYNLGAGVNAPPITYEVNGEQYVAVAAGGNFQLSFPLGDTVAIFKLPGGEEEESP